VDRVEIEDLFATFFLSIGFDPKTIAPVFLGMIESFAARAGIEKGEDREVSQAKIRRYLDQHPLNPELKLRFELVMREGFASHDTGSLERAFARFADEELAKCAPSRERPKGTRPGYLALLAHDDVER